MANFFKNQNANSQTVTPRQALENKYTVSRHNLLLVIVFTFINIVLLATNADSYFLFSAYIPYYVLFLGMYLCGKFPAEFYEPDLSIDGFTFLPDAVFIVTLVIAVISVLLYFLCWLFSNKNRVGWMIAALVLFSVDTLAMFLLNGINFESVLDIFFHAYVMYYLIMGVSSHFKLKKMPVSEEPVTVNATATDEYGCNTYIEEEKTTASEDNAKDE